jgi:hypothetical protein
MVWLWELEMWSKAEAKLVVCCPVLSCAVLCCACAYSGLAPGWRAVGGGSFWPEKGCRQH